jgi:hypothetical protein
MNGYLMQEMQWTAGQDTFIECLSPENQHGVVFEDDGETAYFYAVEKDKEGDGIRILDALHVRNTEEAGPEPADLKIVWSRDWQKCALVIDGYVHALFDFEKQGGYNVNEFPPPNELWTQGDRKLDDDLIQRLF